MKKLFLSLFVLVFFGNLLVSCSTDVDLYADYKDITVIYGLLDYKKDTNYIKINKAFLGPGNALEIALIADSCNYPGKLDSKIIEYRAPINSNQYQQTRVLPLDTLTIHDKEEGIFYAPDQMVYYTAERINVNSQQFKYKYELQVDRGDTILTSNTNIVGGESKDIITSVLSFDPNVERGSIKWAPFSNACVYEVVIGFNWAERRPDQDTVYRTMKWSLGTHPESSINMENNMFILTYRTVDFFTNLASELGADTLDPRIDRIVRENPLSISIAAGGEELYNFISVNGPSSSIVQNIPEYTNISGGYGVFSSRNLVVKNSVRMSSRTFTALVSRDWGFRQGK